MYKTGQRVRLLADVTTYYGESFPKGSVGSIVLSSERITWVRFKHTGSATMVGTKLLEPL
jgi:hypothetical protein